MSNVVDWVNVVGEDGKIAPMRYELFVLRLFKVDSQREMLSHAAMGIAGEAGELLDAVKKHLVYGKQLDVANIREELGDLRFYIEAMQNILGIDSQDILQGNVNKLDTRYKKLTYSSEAAIARADKTEGT